MMNIITYIYNDKITVADLKKFLEDIADTATVVIAGDALDEVANAIELDGDRNTITFVRKW